MNTSFIWKTTTSLLFLSLISLSTFAESEVDCLAKNIYFESRGEPESGQFVVGFVTLNRVKDSRWPNTFCEVIKQPNQYEWYWDGKSDKPTDAIAYGKAEKIAQVVIKSLPYDMTHYGYYFKTIDANSKFFNKLTLLYTVGNHEVYTDATGRSTANN